MSVLRTQSLIMSPDGEVLLTIREDHEELCQAVDEIKNTTNGWSPDRTMKLTASVPAQEYHHWGELLGYECWEHNDFLKFWNANTKGRYCI